MLSIIAFLIVLGKHFTPIIYYVYKPLSKKVYIKLLNNRYAWIIWNVLGKHYLIF